MWTGLGDNTELFLVVLLQRNCLGGLGSQRRSAQQQLGELERRPVAGGWPAGGSTAAGGWPAGGSTATGGLRCGGLVGGGTTHPHRAFRPVQWLGYLHCRWI
jgi:hypothetical protein